MRRVPPSANDFRAMQGRLEDKSGPEKPPSTVLWACMQGMKTDWALAKKIASKILEPMYTLAQFNSDLSCFPELSLYLLDNPASIGGRGANGETNTSNSGRTIGDEYQRTIGAFYAIYWMMRIDIDGKEGFANGVDKTWTPITLTGADDLRVTQAEKRIGFQNNAKWDFFHKLLIDAGLFEEKKVGTRFNKSATKVQVCEKRLVSLLALTAIHDIMKMSMILPVVQKQHEPYHRYVAGDTIGDHDHALSYVMDNYPDILPSFRDLEQGEKRSVQFTQCNLCFNHGWFVQAEAPPGATFTKFKDALIRDHKAQIERRDVALYFVHWLTDLAGAEPTPLGGCEKFVTKFPLEVLNSFLRSFEYVQKITDHTETEVMEEYLKIRWAEHTPSLGPVPTGDSAIAKMRILCMAQMKAERCLQGFDDLSEDDRELLNVEMSRTGTLCQCYSKDLVPQEVSTSPAGPAFLVYYGPAFLQNLGQDNPAQRLSILAEVYRRARELWPVNVAKAAQHVIIRVDMIKSLSTAQILDAMGKGDVWLMMKHNESEAFIERCSQRKLNKLIATGQHIQILDLIQPQ